MSWFINKFCFNWSYKNFKRFTTKNINLLKNKLVEFIKLYKSTLIKKPHNSRIMRFNIWWAHRDLNTGPTDYESAALTN